MEIRKHIYSAHLLEYDVNVTGQLREISYRTKQRYSGVNCMENPHWDSIEIEVNHKSTESSHIFDIEP